MRIALAVPARPWLPRSDPGGSDATLDAPAGLWLPFERGMAAVVKHDGHRGSHGDSGCHSSGCWGPVGRVASGFRRLRQAGLRKHTRRAA